MDEITATRTATEKEVQAQYEGLKEQLLRKSDDILDSMKDELMHSLMPIDEDISSIQNCVSKIVNEMNEEINKINNFDKETIHKKIEQAKQTVFQELSSHDAESLNKYKNLVASNDEKFRKLDETFQRSVADLKKKFFLSSKDKPPQVERFVKKCQDNLNSLNDYKQKVIKAETEYKSMIENFRKRFFVINSKKLPTKADLDEFKLKCDEEISKYKELLNDVREIQKKELQRLNDKYQNEIEIFNQFKTELEEEYEKTKIFFSSNTTLSNEQFEELKNSLNNEYIHLKEKIITDENEISKKLVPPVFVPKDDDDYFHRLVELKKMHETEIHFKQGQYQTDIVNENDDFISKKEDLNKMLQQINEIDSFQAIIQNMEKKFDNELKIFEENSKKEIIEIKNDLKNEQINQKDHLENELSEFIALQEQKIKDFKDLKIKEKYDKKSQLENQRLSFLSNLSHDFESDKVIDNVINEYYQTFKNLENEYTNFDNTVNTVEVTNEDIKNEKLLKKSHKENNLKEQDELIQKWKDSINDEKLRYEEQIAIQKEEELRSTSKTDFKVIQLEFFNRFKQKDEILESLEKEMKELLQVKYDISTPDLDQQIESLNTLINKLNNENNHKFEQEQDKTNEIMEPFKQQIKDQINVNFQNLQIEKRKIELELEEQSRCLNQTEANYSKAKAFRNSCISREMTAFQLEEQKMKNNFIKTVDDLRRQIVDEKQRELPDTDKELTKQWKHLAIIENATIAQNKVAIEELLKKKNEINKKYNKLIKEAKAKCQELKDYVNNRGVRPQEKKIIDRLEGILEIKNAELTAHVKDIISYRARLQAQEEVYNNRFGVSPKVAVAMVKPRAATQMSKMLPPL
ncbi:hypothetical protein TRFO_32321 [Tritrichomonas foetus]|uniref:Uncharacterized protein n=1 Tax=Tritrichomonas foetus TaxID=1144522 RepID=A0A1J4JUG9_9EUKA|nr:hypothetical protein TRFO_32321 [Tritrichomonas foetus]|eukprot:OHT00893.1 hypothetical protein TRFO_32321 [Tritrichomonas foetus]